METKEHNKQWHLVRNNNGEWISDDYAEFLTPLEVGILQVKAAQQGIQLDVQYGADDVRGITADANAIFYSHYHVSDNYRVFSEGEFTLDGIEIEVH